MKCLGQCLAQSKGIHALAGATAMVAVPVVREGPSCEVGGKPVGA